MRSPLGLFAVAVFAVLATGLAMRLWPWTPERALRAILDGDLDRAGRQRALEAVLGAVAGAADASPQRRIQAGMAALELQRRADFDAVLGAGAAPGEVPAAVRDAGAALAAAAPAGQSALDELALGVPYLEDLLRAWLLLRDGRADRAIDALERGRRSAQLYEAQEVVALIDEQLQARRE